MQIIKAISLLLICLLLLQSNSFAQSKLTERLKVEQSSNIKKTAYSNKENIIEYSSTIKEAGIYSVLVINPQGQIVGSPIKEQRIEKAGSLAYKFDTKNWRQGSYRVLLYDAEKRIVDSKKLRILPPGLSLE